MISVWGSRLRAAKSSPLVKEPSISGFIIIPKAQFWIPVLEKHFDPNRKGKKVYLKKKNQYLGNGDGGNPSRNKTHIGKEKLSVITEEERMRLRR